MKCFVGIVVPKEAAETLWVMQTRVGQLLARAFGEVPFSQGKAPLHVRVIEPFEAGGFGGPENVSRMLGQIATHFGSFEASVEGVGSNGATDIHALVAPQEEITELRARISACLGLQTFGGELVPRIRLAHDLPDRVFDPAERAFSLAYCEEKGRGTMPLPFMVGKVQLFKYGRSEWEPFSEHSLRAA
jgi:hypothetical protein